MITIYINDEQQEIHETLSLQEILFQRYSSTMHFAVAINDQFIPKILHSTTFLNAEDKIAIIVPMQGG